MKNTWPMRTLYLVMFAIAICGLGAVGDELEPPRHSIELLDDSQTLVIGHSLILTVEYQNYEETAWQLRTPEESLAVHLRYRLADTQKRPYGYSLGQSQVSTKKLPNGLSLTLVEDPAPSKLAIAPKAVHRFAVEFERGWTGSVVPGRWRVWIHDEGQEIDSNQIEISVRFTLESAEECLKISSDAQRDLYERAWCAEWLQRFDPDLKLEWPEFDAPEAVKVERENKIQKQLQEFAEYWETAQNSRKAARIIAEINRAAGLDPETEIETHDSK